ALGLVGISSGKRSGHLLRAHSQLVQEHGIELGSNSRVGAAPDENLSDPGNLCKLLRQDGVGGVVDFGQANGVGGQRQNQDGRVGGVHLAIAEIAGQVCGKLSTSGVNGGLDVPRVG